MKYQEITFFAAVAALKRQWKVFVLTIAAFASMGIGAGFLYAHRLEATVAGSADQLPAVEFSDSVYDTNYYQSCYSELSRFFENMAVYVQSLSEEKTLSLQQKTQLDAYKEELKLWKEDILTPIKKDLDRRGAVYIPSDLIEDAIEEYEEKLYRIEEQIVISKQAVDIIKSMDAPNFENESISKTYDSLLKQAASYGSNLNTKVSIEKTLDLLKNQRSIVLADSRALEKQEKLAQRTLDNLASKINQTSIEIAEANNLNISNQFDTSASMSVTITHTHSSSTAQEIFMLLTLLFILIGVCCGAFLAVCAECNAFHGFKSLKRKA